ncbi:Cadherin domain family protein [Acanthocheilonema viteae]
MMYRFDVLLLQICSLFVDTVSQIMMTRHALRTIQDNVKIPSLHPPILKASSHEGYIMESAEMGTTVRISPSPFSDSLQITIYDNDLKPGMPPAVYEYILTGPGSSIFAVDQRGYVYLNVPYVSADPPNPSTYQLHIEAREVNTTPIRSSEPISVIIHVMDINNNPPRFSSSVYVANVSASGTDRPVIQIHATDNDVGKNAQISYHLVSVSGGAHNNFWYDSNAHQLNVVGNLKAGERYEVVLKAFDDGGLSSQALIIVYAVPDNFQEVTVLDQKKASSERNQIIESVDSFEAIQTYVTEISEATPPYSIIITLGDDSTKGQMYHTITDGNEDNKFAISSEIGTLITINSFDREEASLYSLQIETRSLNSDQHLYWTIVQVAIADINDNAPIFIDPQPIRLRVEISDVLNLAPNTYVGQVNVKDPDDGNNGRVALKIAPPMDKLFSINDSGVITVNGDLLSGHFGEHRMTVIATDYGDPPLETRINIITNIENALQSASTNSTQLSTESSSLKRINLTPNSINSPQNMQFTSDSAIPATVQTATESPTLRFAPVFDPSEITVTVKENQANIELVKLHAYYMDNKPGSITYVMLSGDPSLFNVNSFTGSLHLLRPLDMEEETSYEIRVGTAEAVVLFTEPNSPHTVLVTVNVVDINDWIPNFELHSYKFKVNADAKLGTTIGQIVAYDQDRTAPNNEIFYRIKESNTNESYINVDPKSGLLTVKKDLHLLANKKISLNIEAEDGGTPKQSSKTFALIDVEPEEIVILTGRPSTFDSSSSNKLQFSQRNYSSSLLESVQPSHLLLVLPVLNKPTNERFTTCSIISGNYGGVFSISTDSEGNCELQTQALLDRETVDYYQLNVSVKTEQRVDYAIVHVTVFDTNDNAPEFIPNNDEYNGYFAALSTDASSFAFIITVQAKDADLGNNSAVMYSLDPFSMDSKYFMIDPIGGKIQTKISATQMMENSQKNYFIFRVIACDSPLAGKKLCSKAEIFVNIISDSNRFILSVLNTEPRYLKTVEREIAKVLSEFTDPCKLLLLESVEENQNNIKKQRQVNMRWYAVNPITKTSCKVDEYSKLFDNTTIRTIAKKLKPQIVIGEIRNQLKSVLSENAMLFTNFKTTSVAMIVLAVTITVGALIGICAICLCYTRHRIEQHSKHEYPNINQIPKFGTIFLPNGPVGSSHDMLYETQMLEMPIGEEESMVKTIGNGGGITIDTHGILCSSRYDLDVEQSYHQNFVQNALTDKRKFSIEENIFTINKRNDLHSQKSKRMQEMVIPNPDYPMGQKKSVF